VQKEREMAAIDK